MVGGLAVDGMPAIAGAAALIPQLGSELARDPGTPTILVFVDQLDAGELGRRGEHDLVRALQPVAADAEVGTSLSLRAHDGSLAGGLTWEQRLPGSQMRRVLVPWLCGVAAATLALVGLALRDASRPGR